MNAKISLSCPAPAVDCATRPTAVTDARQAAAQYRYVNRGPYRGPRLPPSAGMRYSSWTGAAGPTDAAVRPSCGASPPPCSRTSCSTFLAQSPSKSTRDPSFRVSIGETAVQGRGHALSRARQFVVPPSASVLHGQPLETDDGTDNGHESQDGSSDHESRVREVGAEGLSDSRQERTRSAFIQVMRTSKAASANGDASWPRTSQRAIGEDSYVRG